MARMKQKPLDAQQPSDLQEVLETVVLPGDLAGAIRRALALPGDCAGLTWGLVRLPSGRLKFWVKAGGSLAWEDEVGIPADGDMDRAEAALAESMHAICQRVEAEVAR